MNLIIAVESGKNTDQWINVTYVRVAKDQSLSEPATISREELIQKIRAGLNFHRLNKVGCRWDIGAEVVVEKNKFGYQLREKKGAEEPLDQIKEI